MCNQYHSETIAEITKALTMFQSKIGTIPKNKTVKVTTKSGSSYTYTYSPYDTIIEHIKEPLSSSGLAFTQIVFGGELVTMLLHSTGEWFKSTIKLIDNSNDPQVYGGDITYKRRYSLSSILGIATDEDDDAEGVKKNSQQNKENKKPPKEEKPILVKGSKTWDRVIQSFKETGSLDAPKKVMIIPKELEDEILNDPF